MALCTNVSKFFLILVNAFFWLTGFGLVFLGAWMFNEYACYGHGLLTLGTALLPALILLVVGVLSCLLGLIGCVATFKEQKCITGLYFTLLLVIFWGFIAGGVLSFVFSKSIDTELRHVMTEGLTNYLDNENARVEVNLIQSKMLCCGVDNYNDWQNTSWYHNQTDTTHEYPESCCAPLNCTYTSSDVNLHSEGCYAKMKSLFKGHLIIVASVACGFAGIVLLGMISSCVLLWAKRNRSQEIRYIGIPDPDGLRV
jgi:hypothetical protein